MKKKALACSLRSSLILKLIFFNVSHWLVRRINFDSNPIPRAAFFSSVLTYPQHLNNPDSLSLIGFCSHDRTIRVQPVKPPKTFSFLSVSIVGNREPSKNQELRLVNCSILMVIEELPIGEHRIGSSIVHSATTKTKAYMSGIPDMDHPDSGRRMDQNQ